MKKKIICIILARGGSKGIPRKNIYPINGHPLISYSIQAAKEAKFIDKIVVSTDDKRIAKISRDYGAETPFLRSKKLSGDKVPSMDALRDCALKCENFYNEKYDIIIELPCVSPLRDASYVNRAIKIIKSKNYDSVVSYVNTGEKHPIRLKRITNNTVKSFCREYIEPSTGSRRQDFEACYIRNGAIYCMTRKCLINDKSRIGKKSFPLIMPQDKSINIDEKFDLTVADLLIRNGLTRNKPKKVIKYKNFYYFKNNSAKKILVSAPTFFLQEEINKLKKKFNITITNNCNIDNIKKLIQGQECWICHPSPEYLIDKKILQNAKKLKLLLTPSTGSTHIDLRYCERNRIKVLPISKSSAFKEIKASSEFTFLLILMCLKQVIKSRNIIINNNWRNSENQLRGNELYGKKVLIIGQGRIGQNLKKYLKSFEANISSYDPFINAKKHNFNDLYKKINTADVVVVCISYNKQNFNFIDKKIFSRMKKNAVFINTSRGEVVNEKDLILFLKKNKIKFAAVDVIKNEQFLNKRKSILIEYFKNNHNLLVTPHMAGLTYESETKAFQICVANAFKYLK